MRREKLSELIILETKNLKTMESNIEKMQRIYGYSELQKKIDSGKAWKSLSTAIQGARAISIGACMLPKIPCRDVFGEPVPSRGMAYYNEAGSVDYCREYWRKYWRVKEIILSN